MFLAATGSNSTSWHRIRYMMDNVFYNQSIFYILLYKMKHDSIRYRKTLDALICGISLSRLFPSYSCYVILLFFQWFPSLPTELLFPLVIIFITCVEKVSMSPLSLHALILYWSADKSIKPQWKLTVPTINQQG